MSAENKWDFTTVDTEGTGSSVLYVRVDGALRSMPS
jgi:hypothetical protein